MFTVTTYSLWLMVTLPSMDMCNTWSEISYGNKYSCFELVDEDGFKQYGQFFIMKYKTLGECSRVSKEVMGENNCYESYSYTLEMPVPRPDKLKERQD